MVIRTLQGFPLWYPGVHLGAVFIVRMYAAERYVFGFLPMSSISRISPFMDCMEERDVRCPFLFSVLCLNYYEIFLILRKTELLMKTTTVALGPHFEDFPADTTMPARWFGLVFDSLKIRNTPHVLLHFVMLLTRGRPAVIMRILTRWRI